MDWQERMSKALNYLEAHLEQALDLEAAARAANCSTFHFFRMFEVITGLGPAEYVRRRRLSLAALALSSSDEKIVDLALRLGWESPDAFSRAFKREYGCQPSAARQPGARLHSFPPLAITFALVGDKAMEYRIENGPALELVGINQIVSTAGGQNFQAVPAFWQKIMHDGSWENLLRLANPKGLGICGVCRDFDMASEKFIYSIAIDRPASSEKLPAGWTSFSIPAVTWGKFTSRGPMAPNFQPMIKRIFSEWLPSSGWEHAGSAEIEYYSDGHPEAADYWCEYWVPLRKA